MNPDLRWLSRDPHKRWARTRYRDPVTGAQMIYSTQIVYDAPLQIAFMTVFYERADGQRGRARAPRCSRTGTSSRASSRRCSITTALESIRRDGNFAGGALEAGAASSKICGGAARAADQDRLWGSTRPRLSTENLRIRRAVLDGESTTASLRFYRR